MTGARKRGGAKQHVYLPHLFVEALQMPAALDARFRCSSIGKVPKVKQDGTEAMLALRGCQKSRNQAAET